MISIVAKFMVNKEDEDKFLELIQELGKASNEEEGCIEYLLHKHIKEPLIYCLVEKWKDQAAIDLHNNSPHFTDILPQITEIAQVEVEVYTPV